MAQLPPGFQLEAAPAAQAQALPPGFQLEPMQPPVAPGQPPMQGFEPTQAGFLSSITGAGREAVETRDLPELVSSDLLAGEDIGRGLAVAPAVLSSTDPNEIAQILTKQFPNIGLAYQRAPDGSVYPVLRNNETGAATVINRPGMTGMDVLQGLGLAAAYAPTGAGTIARAAAKSAAVGTGLEAAQAGAGGQFDPMTIALDAAFGGGGQAVTNLVNAMQTGSPNVASAAKRKAKEFYRNRYQSEYGKKPTKAQENEIIEALTKGDAEAVARLAQPSEEVVEAGQTLGLQEAGLASAVASSPEFIAKEQALKSVPGSPLQVIEDRAVTELKQKADDLITQFGGTREKAALSQDLRSEATKTIDDLADQAETAYKEIGELIEPTTVVNTSSLADALETELVNLGGRPELLSQVEKKVMSLIEGPVTYQAVDRVRKDIGQALRKKSGPFKDASEGELKRYYGLLTDVQENAAPEYSDLWSQAKSLVSQRKDLETQAQTAFGKKLSDAFMPKFGQAMQQLGRGDYKKFDELIATIPKDRRQEVVTSSLNDVFTQASRKEKQLSIPGFADWYNSISSDPALKNRVFKHLDPEMRTMLTALGVRTNALRKAQERQITTGRVLAAPGVLNKMVDGVAAMTLAKLPGFTGAVASEGLEMSKRRGEKAALDLLTDPVFVNNITKLATDQAEKAEQTIMRSKKFKEFLAKNQPIANVIGRVGLRNYLLSLSEQDPQASEL